MRSRGLTGMDAFVLNVAGAVLLAIAASYLWLTSRHNELRKPVLYEIRGKRSQVSLTVRNATAPRLSLPRGDTWELVNYQASLLLSRKGVSVPVPAGTTVAFKPGITYVAIYRDERYANVLGQTVVAVP